MYEVGVTTSFRARHYLRGDFGDESRPHGHTYRVEWRCSITELDRNGFAVDISVVEAAISRVARDTEGRLLNDLPFFGDRQPSLENFAAYVSERVIAEIGPSLPPPPTLIGTVVRVWESDTAWASFHDGGSGISAGG